MEKVKKSYEELKGEIFELNNLIDELDFKLEMAKQVLNDNEEYFELEAKCLEFYRDQAIRRNRIAIDFLFRAMNEIKDVRNRLDGGSCHDED